MSRLVVFLRGEAVVPEFRALGTMDEIRDSAASGAEGLEQIFLRLTGENAARELVDVLDA